MKVKATYTLAEVARLLGLPESTVRDMGRSGKLTTTNFGGRTLVPLAALKANALVWDSIRTADKINRAS